MARESTARKAATPIAAPHVATPTRQNSGKVTVACKIPTGLEIQLCTKTTYWEDTPSGAKERQRWDRGGPTIILRGTAVPNGAAPRGYRMPQMAGGYALTEGVDAAFFDEWMEQNKLNPLVVNKMVFAHSRRSETVAEARELKEVRSGFEAIQTDHKGEITDKRVEKPTGTGLTSLATADEMVRDDTVGEIGDNED
jgi:hypothetical protein